MSLATFKKKAINKYSTATKRSGKPPGGYWLPQGPFGLNTTSLEDAINYYGPAGFSIQGSRRSISVGKDMKFSQQGTRFRGIHPYGNGGTYGRYYVAEPVLNAGNAIVEVKGNQWEYVKPSVLSTKGMLEKKYKWINNGQYPNYWVQPNYTGNQTDSASQGLYVQNKAAANDCWYDVNNTGLYTDYFKFCGSNGCQPTPARGYTMNIQQANAPYTKTLHQPKDASAYTLRIQRRCQDPRGTQKPFPYAVNTGTGVLRGGTSVSRVASSCGTSNPQLTPPEWYWRTNSAPQPQFEQLRDKVTGDNTQTYIAEFLNGTTY